MNFLGYSMLLVQGGNVLKIWLSLYVIDCVSFARRCVQSPSLFLRWIFRFVVCYPFSSSPSLTVILVPLRFIVFSLFFYLSKLLFSSAPQFKVTFVRGRNNSKWLSCFNFVLLERLGLLPIPALPRRNVRSQGVTRSLPLSRCLNNSSVPIELLQKAITTVSWE